MRVMALAAVERSTGLIQMGLAEISSLAVVTREASGRHFGFHQFSELAGMRGVTIQAGSRCGGRMRMFGLKRLLDSGMT